MALADAEDRESELQQMEPAEPITDDEGEGELEAEVNIEY